MDIQKQCHAVKDVATHDKETAISNYYTNAMTIMVDKHLKDSYT